MATAFKVVYTTSDKLSEITLSPGQLIFCEDNRSIHFVNKDTEMIDYTAVIVLAKETHRTALSHPFPALYFVKETNILWRYQDGEWIALNEKPEQQIVFTGYANFPEVGNEETLYIDGKKIYRYIDGVYSMLNESSMDFVWGSF